MVSAAERAVGAHHDYNLNDQNQRAERVQFRAAGLGNSSRNGWVVRYLVHCGRQNTRYALIGTTSSEISADHTQVSSSFYGFGSSVPSMSY